MELVHIVVNVDGITSRALLARGAGSAYASATLIKHLGKQPSRTEHKRIEMMMCSTTQKIESVWHENFKYMSSREV